MEAWRALGNTLDRDYEKVTSGPSMLFTPAAHAFCARALGELGAAVVEQLAVADHAERLAQPAIAREGQRAVELLAVLRSRRPSSNPGTGGGSGPSSRGCRRPCRSSVCSVLHSGSWLRGSGGPITLAPVTHAWRCRPSRPPQSCSKSSGGLHALAGLGLQEHPVPARPHELRGLRTAQRARIGHDVLGLRRRVDPVDREPVVVVDALGAVGRRARAELLAHLQRRRDVVVVEAHEGVPEPVRARVALVAGPGLGAELDRDLRARPPRSAARPRSRGRGRSPAEQPGSLVAGRLSISFASVRWIFSAYSRATVCMIPWQLASRKPVLSA